MSGVAAQSLHCGRLDRLIACVIRCLREDSIAW